MLFAFIVAGLASGPPETRINLKNTQIPKKLLDKIQTCEITL